LENEEKKVSRSVKYKRPSGVNLNKVFLRKIYNFPFFAINLGCFKVSQLFSYVTKGESLTVKYRKTKKNKVWHVLFLKKVKVKVAAKHILITFRFSII
jgi:hypothetical protein